MQGLWLQQGGTLPQRQDDGCCGEKCVYHYYIFSHLLCSSSLLTLLFGPLPLSCMSPWLLSSTCKEKGYYHQRVSQVTGYSAKAIWKIVLHQKIKKNYGYHALGPIPTFRVHESAEVHWVLCDVNVRSTTPRVCTSPLWMSPLISVNIQYEQYITFLF